MRKEKKTRLRMRSGKFAALTAPGMALVLAAAVALSVVSTSMASTLDTYLGKGKTVPVAADGTEDWDTAYYTALYGDRDEAREGGYQVVSRIMQEGTILLKNNGVLPLAEGSTLTPFGRGYLDPIYGQLTSSGSGKWIVEPVTPAQALAESFTLNNAAVDKMQAAPDPEGLAEAPGTSAAGAAGSVLGGNSYIYEYDPAVYDGLADVSGTTGIVLICRAGQEGSDKKFDAYADGTPHYLALTENEKAAIRTARQACGSVVVVLVSSAPLELSPLMDGDCEADAILWVGHPGERGFADLPDILTGAVTPSGRTVDIFPADFTKDPSYQNIGDFSYDNLTVTSASYTDGGTFNRHYLEYQEDVYMGYRYYETADAVDDSFVYGTLDGQGGIETAGAVCYPFGYGLSYTTFSQQIVGWDDSGDDIQVQVQVTNTGDTWSGKEVVQLYYNPPYTQFDIDNRIEKPVATLAAFAKTELLAPGESETVTLSFAKEDMASYCYTHTNPDGTVGCYVLEAGDYEITLRANSHDVLDTRVTTLDETFWFDGSDEAHIRQSDRDAQSTLNADGTPTGTAMDGSFTAATNLFQTSSDYMNQNSRILSRADWQGTFPAADADRTKSILPEFAEQLGADTDFDVYTDPEYGNVEGSQAYREQAPVSGADNGLTLADMRGLDYEDPKWEAFLDQLDFDADKNGLILNFAGAAYALGSLPSLGVPATVQEDGANGLKIQGSDNGYDMTKSTTFPFHPTAAATWNVALLYEMGAALAQDALANGVNGWYSPGINLHRSPFSGRVFEYFSEDPLLSGKLAAACLSGAGDNGLTCYLKHFAMNETETNRAALVTVWATEQAMRELYLRAFEIAIKEARMTVKYTADDTGATETRVMRAATGVMAAQLSVGTRMGHCNNALQNELLRDEWGFRGMVITDYWVWGDNNLRDLCLRTGADAYLCMAMPAMWNLTDYDSPSAQWAMRGAVHNICYALANSNAMQGAAPGTTFRTEPSPWQLVLIPLDILLYALVVLYAVRLALRIRDQKRHPEHFKPRRKKAAPQA